MTSHYAMDGERVALQGGGGREWEGEGTPQEGNLTQRRREAESAERKIETMTENEGADGISKRILSPWISRLDCLSTSRTPLNPINLCALCLSAPLRESKTTTREIRRILCPLNPMTPLNLTTPLNSINLCALCLSAPLRESKRQRARRRAPGRRQTHPPSGIMLTAAANNRQRRNIRLATVS